MLTQDVVVKLILQHIGGAKLKPSTLLDVEGLPSMVRTAPLASLVTSLSQFGSTGQEIRDNLLKNPRAESANKILSAIPAFEASVNDSTLSAPQKSTVLAAVEELETTVTDYLRHTNILSGKEVGDPLAEQSQQFIDLITDIAANAANGSEAANAAWAAANAAWANAQAAFANAQSALDYALLATGAANLAGDYAVAANNSAASANSSSSAANGYAFLAAGHASSANSAAFQANLAAVSANSSAASANSSAVLSANFAGQANSAAIVAQQFAADANASAANASASLIITAGHAAAANSSAAAAAANAVAAQGFAVSANNSASNAASQVTLASGFATAANNSAGAAAANAVSAQSSATSANTSAASANSSAVLAAGFATAANSSAAAAAANAVAAQGFAVSANSSAANAASQVTLAAGHAAAANSSASASAANAVSAQSSAASANTSAASANSSAVLASGFATAANSSAAAAAANAVSAQSSATAANSSAASANTSSTLAASFSEDAARYVVDTFPSTFEQDGKYFSYLTGSEITAVRPEAAGYPISYPTVSYGKVLRINNSGGYTHISQRKRIDLRRVPGRRYRIRAKVNMVTLPSSGTATLICGLYGLGADYATIVYGGMFSEAVPAPGLNLQVDMTSTGLYEVGYDVTIANTLAPDGNGNTAAFSSWGMYVWNPTGSGNLTGVVDVLSISVEDITERTAAASSATIALNAATSANSSAASANTNSILTATYRADTLRINGNFGFDLGMENWFTNDTGTTPIASAGKYLIDTSVYGGSLRQNTNTTGSIFSGTLIPIDTSRKYRMRTRLHAWSPSGTTGATFYVGFVGCDANGNILDHGGYGSYRYAIWQGGAIAHNTHQSPSVIVTGEGNDSWLKFPPGTKFIRPMAIMNYYSENTYTWIDGIFIEDATESEAANASATIASAAAVSANSSAASATTSSALAASLGRGYLNPNSSFADWPSPVGSHSQPGSGWTIWNDLGGTTLVKSSATALGYSPPPEGSDPCMGGILAAGQETGLMSGQCPTTGGTHLLEFSAAISSGGWGGAGILAYFFGMDNTTYLGAAILNCATDPDVEGIVSSSKLYHRRWSKNVTAPTGTGYVRLYSMLGYVGITTTVAKTIFVFKTGIKPRDAVGATVETHSSAIATLDTKTASYMLKTSAGAGTASLIMVATDSGGTPASSVKLIAGSVELGNGTSSVPTLAISNGAATFSGELNVGGTSGGRVNIFKNVIKIFSDSGNLVMKIGNLAL